MVQEQTHATAVPTVVPQGIIAKVTRSGGAAGIVETLIVHSDGTVLFRDELRPHNAKSYSIADTEIRKLQVAVGSNEWKQLHPRYGGQYADGIEYRILAGSREIVTEEDVHTYPPILLQVYEQLNDIFLLAACTDGATSRGALGVPTPGQSSTACG